MDETFEDFLKKLLESEREQNDTKKQEYIFDRIVLEGLKRSLHDMSTSDKEKQNEDKSHD